MEDVRDIMTCRQCRTRKRSRPFGLCFVCYQDQYIVQIYRAKHDELVGGLLEDDQDFHGPSSAPYEPTTELPGSCGKIETMRRRAEQRMSLWHTGDAKAEE